MRHIYYYVPPCPNCGCSVTGRYVRQPSMEAGRTEYDSLRHGELVTEVGKVPEKNCYCENCGYEWKEYIGASFLTTSELEEQKSLRGTERKLRQFKAKYFVNGKMPKQSLLKRLFF